MGKVYIKAAFFWIFTFWGIQWDYASAYRLYLDDFSDFLPAIYLILPAIYLCTESDDKGHSVHASSCPCYGAHASQVFGVRRL